MSSDFEIVSSVYDGERYFRALREWEADSVPEVLEVVALSLTRVSPAAGQENDLQKLA